MRDDTKKIIETFHMSFSDKQKKIIENTETILDIHESVIYLTITNVSVVTAGRRRMQITPDTLVLFTDQRVFLRQPGVFKPITEDIPFNKIQSVECREDTETAGHFLFTTAGQSYDIMIAHDRKIREQVVQTLKCAIHNFQTPKMTSGESDSASSVTCSKESVRENPVPSAAATKKTTKPSASGSTSAKTQNYRYFSHRDCEYFPCHATANPDNFNCLFCYCPFYLLGDQCGGNFRYLSTGVKDCTDCLYPHLRENYDEITARYQEIREAMPRSD